MKKMKKFFIYALLVVALYIFSDMLIYISINATYKTMDTRVYVSSPQVTILESKATHINGVIKGSIKNNTQDIIKNKYFKIDMYSPRDINLGTKYIKVDNLNSGEIQEFELWYEFTDVDHLIITSAKDTDKITTEELSSNKITLAVFLAKLFLLYFI